jgi:glycosyltransferase involved in cell wall biosynthesis
MKGAAVNVTLTGRDAVGLSELDPDLRTATMAPFIEAEPFLGVEPKPEPNHLVAIAMMRQGDKFDSYSMLAAALRALTDTDWRLTIVGDGLVRVEIMALFDGLPGITWAGQLDQAGVREVLSHGALLTWPGSGEAYGLSYLEAQAAGLPVVAQATAGVPEVVRDGQTGLLTAPGDVQAYADAIRNLLADAELRARLAKGARANVLAHHTLDRAAATLAEILNRHVWGDHP